MKNKAITAIAAILLLTSCGSYNAAGGAYTGATFGHVIGSAVGGITGGPRGHDWGSLIGTVGGAMAGAAVGTAVDNAQKKERQAAINKRRSTLYDDVIDFEATPSTPRSIRADALQATVAPLEIREARILEAVSDGRLTRGEECRVVFEIFNTTDETLYDVRPFVEDATGNRHIRISQNLNIESIAPRQGVRYTATIVADRSLRDGQIEIRLGVAAGTREITSQTRTFTVPTAKYSVK